MSTIGSIRAEAGLNVKMDQLKANSTDQQMNIDNNNDVHVHSNLYPLTCLTRASTTETKTPAGIALWITETYKSPPPTHRVNEWTVRRR